MGKVTIHFFLFHCGDKKKNSEFKEKKSCDMNSKLRESNLELWIYKLAILEKSNKLWNNLELCYINLH